MGVGMSNTNRHMTHRRSPVSTRRALPPMGEPVAASSARVEALKKLVAAGQYHVSPKWLAVRIFRSAGVPIVE
jgi:anti-sigma28 factor (negative regulator of flagellin synthesis)